MRPDVLFLAAFEPELAPLRRALGDGSHEIALGLAGIGLATAAAGAAERIAELRPHVVVLVGTCGAYESASLGIADVVVTSQLRLVDPAALDGVAEFPQPMPTSLEASSELVEAFVAVGARPARVATTLAITVDDVVATRIADRAGVDVEHLEAHGVAIACAARGVPFAAVLGVANGVGSRGRAEWRQHHGDAEAAAGACVLRWLRAGAKGVGRQGPG